MFLFVTQKACFQDKNVEGATQKKKRRKTAKYKKKTEKATVLPQSNIKNTMS